MQISLPEGRTKRQDPVAPQAQEGAYQYAPPSDAEPATAAPGAVPEAAPPAAEEPAPAPSYGDEEYEDYGSGGYRE